MLLLGERELRELLTMGEAIEAVEAAFVALAEGRAILPPPIGLEIEDVRGEVHVKGAHLRGEPTFAFKVASGFYDNPGRGLPSGSGLMLAFDAATGRPEALLLDNAWLTDLRTGAAGGVAARWLAPESVERVAILGAGVQARIQLRALLEVRAVGSVRVWNRNPERAVICAREMSEEHTIDARSAATVAEAVDGAAVVVTATPAREPLLGSECPPRACHVTAVGSDGPGKQELSVELLARADLLVVDHRDQCLRLGEAQRSVRAGVDEARLVELGDVIGGRHPGRDSPGALTIADLTGVGVQDAAIAGLALARARAAGVGTEWRTS